MANADNGFESILVATDFSPYAEAALKQAAWLARKAGAHIVLANAIPDLSMSAYWGPYEREANQRELHQRSDAAMRQMIVNLNATDVDVVCRTLVGEPFVEIIHAVQAESHDIVLAGTQGLAVWERFFIGSTAKRLIRKCPASVWIVKRENVHPPKVVLAATDFSDVSLKAVKEGLWIARQSRADFHVLHVIDSNDVPEDLVSRIPEGSSLRREIDEEASRRLERLQDSLAVDWTQVRVHFSWGTPWQEIRRISRHQSADLIVIGTVGRSGIKGLLLGNTAEKVLDTGECSILAVKPEGFVSPIEPASSPQRPGPEGHGR